MDKATRASLRRRGWGIEKDADGNYKYLPGAQGTALGPYYNKETGQQFEQLPLDYINQITYRHRNMVPGRAPVALRRKWDKGAAARLKAVVGNKNMPMAHDVPLAKQAQSVKKLEDQVEKLTKMVAQLLAAQTKSPVVE